MKTMERKTRMNGGQSSLQEVAEAWAKEVHGDPWSKIESDKWTVEFAKRLKEKRLNEGPLTPDPRNTHGN
jgi:hypothetical protein